MRLKVIAYLLISKKTWVGFSKSKIGAHCKPEVAPDKWLA